MKLRIKKYKKRLIFFLIVVIICGFWIYRQSIRNEPVSNITPSLNTPFDIFHPIASIKARDSEIAEWSAVINREPSAVDKELALEDAFFHRVTTRAYRLQVLFIPTPRQLVFPLIGPPVITSPFGKRINPVTHKEEHHNGIDLAAEEGSLVMSASYGIVVWRGNKLGYGNCVVIRHGRHLSTIYGHLSRIDIHKGQFVKFGQVLGLSGSTGLSTGPHLHFEVRYNGTPINPLSLLPDTNQ
jgi:murein DD-endopeptidase MepM/ murein hydrolase activator NlpD